MPDREHRGVCIQVHKTARAIDAIVAGVACIGGATIIIQAVWVDRLLIWVPALLRIGILVFLLLIFLRLIAINFFRLVDAPWIWALSRAQDPRRRIDDSTQAITPSEMSSAYRMLVLHVWATMHASRSNASWTVAVPTYCRHYVGRLCGIAMLMVSLRSTRVEQKGVDWVSINAACEKFALMGEHVLADAVKVSRKALAVGAIVMIIALAGWPSFLEGGLNPWEVLLLRYLSPLCVGCIALVVVVDTVAISHFTHLPRVERFYDEVEHNGKGASALEKRLK